MKSKLLKTLSIIVLLSVLISGIASIIGSGGGGGGGDVAPIEECSAYIEIKTTYPADDITYSTVYEYVYLSGAAFKETDDLQAYDTGVDILWQNLSTGWAGDAIEYPERCCFLGACWTCGTLWTAYIPLQVGSNELEVKAISNSKCGKDGLNLNRVASYAISGTVTKNDGSPYPGVNINISGDLVDNPQSSTQTDSNGVYLLSRIPVGTHIITPGTDCDIDVFTPQNQTVNIISSDILNQDFVATPNPATYSVSGTVTYEDGSSAEGMPIIISNNVIQESTLTEGNGYYLIDNVPVGIYNLRPEIENFNFIPEMREAEVCTGNLPEQDFVAISSADILWKKKYGMQGNEYPTAVATTSDNKIIIAGVASTSDGGENGFLIKLDANGHVIWQLSLGYPGTYPCWGSECPYMERIQDITETADGGYVMAGKADNQGRPVPWIVKLDTDGDISWQRTYRRLNHYGEAQAIRRTEDGGLIVAGNISPTDGSGSEAIWLAKLNADGTIVWQQAYVDNKATSNTGKAMAYDVQQTTDGGYILTGVTSSYYYLNSYHNAFIMKVDTDGEQEWFRSVADSYGLFGIIQTNDGGYITCGVPVMKLNVDGSTSWAKDYGSEMYNNKETISTTPDGNYLVGRLKLDSNGDVIWLQPDSMWSSGMDSFTSVMQDGRFLEVHAEPATIPPNQNYNIFVQTYQNDGENCPGTATTEVTPIAVTEVDGGSQLISAGRTFIESNAYTISQSTNALEETLCWSN